MRFEDLPLREQKHARTRQMLLDALVERLSERSLSEIAVSELAAAANISDATFFNHFQNKDALLTFFIQVWSVEIAAYAQRIETEHESAIEGITALFDHTAATISLHPNVMLEIISLQARMPAALVPPEVPRADRLLRLPTVASALELPEAGLGAILPVFLSRAVARGELAARVDVPALTLALASIFFGVPLLLGRKQPDAIGPMYRAQLALVWAGANHLWEVP